MNSVKKDEYIFPTKPKISDVSIDYMAKLQEFYQENGFIPAECVNSFLDWLVTNARLKVCIALDNPQEISYKGCCGRIQSALYDVLQEMEFEAFTFNIGSVVSDCLIHALCIVKIPIFNGQDVNYKYYVLDPTFRQFAVKEENRFERYFEERRYQSKMATPYPGYFLNLTDEGRLFANSVIENGYFLFNEDNIKVYCDAFKLYVTPKEAYMNQELVGKISSTDYSFRDYISLIQQSIDNKHLKSDITIETPIELKRKMDSGILNHFKNLFKRKQDIELYDMIKGAKQSEADFVKKH